MLNTSGQPNEFLVLAHATRQDRLLGEAMGNTTVAKKMLPDQIVKFPKSDTALALLLT
ncbi:MAG: hypothetical protein ACREUR_00340 [Nitrosospira sp.]